MKYFALVSILLSSFTFAKETTYNGKVVETESETKSIQCNENTIETYIEQWPLKYEESAMCSRDTLGFKGMCLYTAWDNTLVTENGERISLPKLHELNKGSDLIFEDRYYVEKPSFCEGNRIYFSLWGGGNCRNGCEAFGFIDLNETNDVISTGLIPYSEYKAKKSNK